MAPDFVPGLRLAREFYATCVRPLLALAPGHLRQRAADDRRLRRPATGQLRPGHLADRYTAQMLHVWVVPYPGGVFSDDLSAAATSSAVQAVLAQHS